MADLSLRRRPQAASEGWQTPPPDAIPPAPSSEGYGAQGAAPYGQQYNYPGYGGYGAYPGHPGYPGYGTGWEAQPQAQPQPRHRGGRTALLAVAVVAGLMVLVVGFGGGIGAALLLGHGIGSPHPRAAALNAGNGSSGNGGGSGNGGNGNSGSGNTGSIDLSQLASQLDPAIVDIDGVQTNAQGQTAAEDAGTGVILTSNGEVLTNNHVIEGNRR